MFSILSMSCSFYQWLSEQQITQPSACVINPSILLYLVKIPFLFIATLQRLREKYVHDYEMVYSLFGHYQFMLFLNCSCMYIYQFIG